MTDPEGRTRHSTARSERRVRLQRRIAFPVAVLTVVPLCAVLGLTSGASAGQLSSAQAKAAQLETEIQTTGHQIDALDQQYLAAEAHKQALDTQMQATQTKIDRARKQVGKDRVTLRKVAVRAYITDGASIADDSLFVGNETQVEAARHFDKVAEGNLSTAMATLRTATIQLDAAESVLRTQDQQAAQAVTTADSAYQKAQTLMSQQHAALAQVKGQIATLIAQQQRLAEQAAQRTVQGRLVALSQSPTVAVASSGGGGVPPPAAGNAGAVAVRAAESQLGVPYVWGGETPGVGFDCSGLTSWAWRQAGVYLPHYSGSQMADSTPVPISDLQPGDLLFYGPGGSEHVAMYIGGGQMIEAPYTGASVWITALRLDTGSFAGAGRP